MMTRNGEEAVDMVVRVDAPSVLTVTITVSPPPGRVVMLVMFGDARLPEFTDCCLPSPSAVTENSRLPLPPPACVTSAVSAPLNSMTTRSHAAPPQTALLVFAEVVLCVADLISVMVAVGAAAASGSSTGARVGIAAGAGDAGCLGHHHCRCGGARVGCCGVAARVAGREQPGDRHRGDRENSDQDNDRNDPRPPGGKGECLVPASAVPAEMPWSVVGRRRDCCCRSWRPVATPRKSALWAER